MTDDYENRESGRPLCSTLEEAIEAALEVTELQDWEGWGDQLRPHSREPGLEVALNAAGGVCALARLVGRTSATVAKWWRIPVDPVNHVLRIEAVLGIPKEKLRPDVYPPPRHPRSPAARSAGVKR